MALPTTHATVERIRGRALAHVGCARARGAEGGRRHSLLVAGAVRRRARAATLGGARRQLEPERGGEVKRVREHLKLTRSEEERSGRRGEAGVDGELEFQWREWRLRFGRFRASQQARVDEEVSSVEAELLSFSSWL